MSSKMGMFLFKAYRFFIVSATVITCKSKGKGKGCQFV